MFVLYFLLMSVSLPVLGFDILFALIFMLLLLLFFGACVLLLILVLLLLLLFGVITYTVVVVVVDYAVAACHNVYVDAVGYVYVCVVVVVVPFYNIIHCGHSMLYIYNLTLLHFWYDIQAGSPLCCSIQSYILYLILILLCR